MAETDFTAVEIERKYLEDKLNKFRRDNIRQSALI